MVLCLISITTGDKYTPIFVGRTKHNTVYNNNNQLAGVTMLFSDVGLPIKSFY